MKTSLLAIAAILLCLSSFKTEAQQKQDSSQPFNKTFFLGSHLFRMPKPPEPELIADINTLKQNGFNLIKIQTHWSADEPSEGKYDFSHYENELDEADRLGLKVYIGLTCEQAPQWLYKKYPDCRMLGKNGLPAIYESQWTLPSDGKPGPCYFHPGAMAAQQRYIKALVATLGKHKSVAVWNVWQEIGLWAESNAGFSVDYNPNTISYFKEWLKQRFKSVEALNKSWGSNFPSWEEVGPSRMPTVIGSGQDVMWRYFMDNEYIAHTLRARYKAIKEADPLKRPVFAHKNAASVGSGQDWNLANSLDFMGSSSYPAWGSFNGWDDEAPSRFPIEKHSSLLVETWNNLSLNFDYIRCANKKGNPVWAAEFQGGPIGSDFHKGRVPSPEDIRRWMLTVVGSGVSSISFWVTRAEIMAYEHNGFSLLNSEGNTTPRFKEAGRVGKALMRYPDLFGTPSKPPASVGIVVDEDNYQFCGAFFGMNQHLSYNMRGWYRYLWNLSIPVDFIPITSVNKQTATQYKALILPFPISISDTNAQRIIDYVQSGGNLISEAGIGRIDENGFSPRGEINPVIRKALGISQKNFQMIKEPGNEHRWMPGERTWGEYLEPAKLSGVGTFNSDSVTANFYLQTFEAGEAEPILKYGNDVAGVTKNIGSGKLMLLGTFIGYNATAHTNETTNRFVEKLISSCGVKRENKGQLLLRRRIGNNREAWILTNAGDKDVTETIDAAKWKEVKDLFGEPLEKNGSAVKVNVKSLDVKVLIMSK